MPSAKTSSPRLTTTRPSPTGSEVGVAVHGQDLAGSTVTV